MEMSGTIQEDWRWAAEADFANNGARILDWWLAYTGIEDTTLAAGHQKQPYSLSVEMSSNDIAYIERSIDNSLVIPFVDRAIGLRMDTNGDNWFFAGGVFGESVGPTDSGAADGPEGWGVAGRFIYAPVITDESILQSPMKVFCTWACAAHIASPPPTGNRSESKPKPPTCRTCSSSTRGSMTMTACLW